MGQKIHPTGFRIGISKKHNSTWFADYDVFSDVLKEDYTIRQFFNKRLAVFCRKVGIVKIEIRKKFKKIELLLYAANPKLIGKKPNKRLRTNQRVGFNRKARFNRKVRFNKKVVFSKKHALKRIRNIQVSLIKLLGGSKEITIKVRPIIEPWEESVLVARLLAVQLEKRIPFRKVIRRVTESLKRNGVKGFKLQVSGRLNGVEMARTEWFRGGRVPLQTLRADINYATERANTIYGVIGIKVWIFKKEILYKKLVKV